HLQRAPGGPANRRITIPEAFLATDAIVILLENIVSGLEVHPARIRARIDEELPFMATEALNVRAVNAGGDRQAVHEVIRVHSIAAARAMKDEGKPNDMLERLAKDPAFPVPSEDLAAVTDPMRFVGRAPQQVEEFLAEAAEPILVAAGEAAPSQVEVRV